MTSRTPLAVVDGNCQGHLLAAILEGAGLAECYALDWDYGFVPTFRGVGTRFITTAAAAAKLSAAKSEGRRTLQISQARLMRSDFTMPYTAHADAVIKYPHLQFYAMAPSLFTSTFGVEASITRMLTLDLRAIKVATERAGGATDFAGLIEHEMKSEPLFHTPTHPNGRLMSLLVKEVAGQGTLCDAETLRKLETEIASREAVNFVTNHPVPDAILSELQFSWPAWYREYGEMIALRDSGRWAELQARAGTFRNLFPEDTQCWLSLARLAIVAGDVGLGQVAFPKLLELCPGYVPYWQLFISFLQRTNHHAAVERVLDAACTILKGQRQLALLLAEFEAQSGRMEVAQQHARNYYEFFPESGEALLPLLRIYAALGQKEEAARAAAAAAGLLDEAEFKRFCGLLKDFPGLGIAEADLSAAQKPALEAAADGARTAVLDRVRAVAAQTFHCRPEEILESTVADDIAGWDSLSYTIFIMNLEAEFQVEFEVSALLGFGCVGDLISSLQEKGVIPA